MGKGSALTLEDVGSFLGKLAEKSEDVYWLSSPDLKKIQYISPAYEKIWSRPREVLYKEPELWITYLHPDDVKDYHPIHAMSERIAKEGASARYHENYRVVRPDGEVRWIIDRGFPIYSSDGKCCGVTGVAVDITKDKLIEILHKEKEKAEAADKIKTAFLENMRHDIRTPLAGITGFAETIKDETTEPKIKEYAANLVTSSNALSSLLDSVLEATNVGSGEIPLLKKKFSLQEELDGVIQLNQAKAHQKNLELLFDYDPAIPKHLIGDPTRLHRIALELVTNALNFTEKGHVRLSAQLAKGNKEDAIVKIVVEDTGIGIEPAKQQELYVRFKRFAPSYEGISKGFGLGLYVTKQFIDDLLGELYVESQVGVGSKFTAIIKLKKPLLGELLNNEGADF
jgi:PAS domain S-box-containing protein